jgi:hypothetical protein
VCSRLSTTCVESGVPGTQTSQRTPAHRQQPAPSRKDVQAGRGSTNAQPGGENKGPAPSSASPRAARAVNPPGWRPPRIRGETQRTRYGPPEVARIAEVEKPTATGNEVLVKVHVTTVNRTDCGFRAARPFIVRFFSGLSSQG